MSCHCPHLTSISSSSAPAHVHATCGAVPGQDVTTMGLFPSHQPELILIQTHKAGPSAPIARRRNEDKCGCQQLPASLFFNLLRVGQERWQERKQMAQCDRWDPIQWHKDKVRESTIKRKHRLHVKACVHGLLCQDVSTPASSPGSGCWAGAPVGLAPQCHLTMRTLRPRDGHQVMRSKGT